MSQSKKRVHHSDPAVRRLYDLQESLEKQTVPQDIKDEVDKILEMSLARSSYCDKITTPATPGTRAITEKTAAHSWKDAAEEKQFSGRLSAGMISGNTEGQLLKVLVSLGGAKRVLEIGMFTGHAALAMAEALPADGRVTTCEIEPYVADIARQFFNESPHGKKIDIKIGPALDTLNALGDNGDKFDLIFIDADKTGYMGYYKAIFEKNLLAPKGTIVVDNALFQGSPYTQKEHSGGGNALEKFNEMVSNDDSVHQVLLSCFDGVLIVKRKEDIEGAV